MDSSHNNEDSVIIYKMFIRFTIKKIFERECNIIEIVLLCVCVCVCVCV